MAMLSEASVSAVLPAVDMARAKQFYQEKLGLRPMMESEDGVLLQAGNGTSVFVYPRPEGTKAEHTVATFVVADVESTVRDLRAKGARFEEYDFPGLKTVNGIATMTNGKSAWFKDTEGNILAVSSIS